MSNARIAAQTARSWQTQPAIWKRIASVAPTRRAHHAETLPRHRRRCAARRRAPSSTSASCGRRALDEREREERRADADEDEQARDRPGRDLRGADDVEDRGAAPARGRRRDARTRCRRASPTAPRRRGSLRVSTATRASSPIRPGSTAFAKRPTENAEKTSRLPGCGSAHRLVDHRAPRERAHDDRREVERDRDDDPLPSHRRERVADRACKLGPRHQSSATTPPMKTSEMRDARRVRAAAGAAGTR